MRVWENCFHSVTWRPGRLTQAAPPTQSDARRSHHSQMNNCLTGVMRVCENSLHSVTRRSGRLAQATPPQRSDPSRSRYSQMNNCLTEVMRVLTDLCDLRTQRGGGDLAACAALPKLPRHGARTTLGWITEALGEANQYIARRALSLIGGATRRVRGGPGGREPAGGGPRREVFSFLEAVNAQNARYANGKRNRTKSSGF